MFYLLPVFLFITCKEKITPILKPAQEVLSADSIELFKYDIMRYAGKLPGKADHTTKFDTVFDNHYKTLAEQHDLVYYVKNEKNSRIKFLLTRVAPSMYVKKVAIGGEVEFNSSGNVTFYKEAFRTWRMLVPELKEKSDMLFKNYLQDKDLTPYYTENSKGVEYIEFPNEHVKYDTIQRLWISSLEDPLEPYYDMKR